MGAFSNRAPQRAFQPIDLLPLGRCAFLSRKLIGANLGRAAAPIVERSTRCDLEFVVASLAPHIAPNVIAAAFAAPPAVHEPDFAGAIDLIQWRTDHLGRQIFSIGCKISRSRIRTGIWFSDRHWPDITWRQICNRKQAEGGHSDLHERTLANQLRPIRPGSQRAVVK